jgi:hypothetical protein
VVLAGFLSLEVDNNHLHHNIAVLIVKRVSMSCLRSYVIDLGINVAKCIGDLRSIDQIFSSSLILERVRTVPNETLLPSTKLSPSLARLSPATNIARAPLNVPQLHEPSQQRISLVIKKIDHEYNFQVCGLSKKEVEKVVLVGRFAAAV